MISNHEESFREGLPENSEDQLQLGFRMIQNAFTSKVNSLENELRGLRLSFDEQKEKATAIQRKNSSLEVELVESHQRSQQLSEENRELFKTVQQLRRQLQRLEGLKKKVMDSIQSHHEDQSAGEYEGGSHREEYLKGALPMTMAAIQGEPMNTWGQPTNSRPASRPASPPPRPPQALAAPHPVGTTSESPYVGGSGTLPAGVSASLGGNGGGGGGAGGMDGGRGEPSVDGKQFFRQARSSLSYEAFNEFLANIKSLNNQQQTREQTLEVARNIFGPELRHLYEEFETLLNRHAV
eukprot:TRINITY_DN57698_c0_g1_i1.p1 TRINITY_DN57698_c0_g1~~TRINITY_DN57698_c0_g1_i1.p1  ORF type:complete len:333 (+),score=83.88 TRINITY_DN57698_c0_g1_i1:116-1000(+)